MPIIKKRSKIGKLQHGSADVTSRGVCTSATDTASCCPPTPYSNGTTPPPSFTTSPIHHSTSPNENPGCLPTTRSHHPQHSATSPTCLKVTPHSSSNASPTCLTPQSASPTCLTSSPIENIISPLIHEGNESPRKMHPNKNSLNDRASHAKGNIVRRSSRKREASTRKKSHGSRDNHRENHHRPSRTKDYQHQHSSKHNHEQHHQQHSTPVSYLHQQHQQHLNGDLTNKHTERSSSSPHRNSNNSNNSNTTTGHHNNNNRKDRRIESPTQEEEDCVVGRDDPNYSHHIHTRQQQQTAREAKVLLRDPSTAAPKQHRSSRSSSSSNQHKRFSYQQELDGGGGGGTRGGGGVAGQRTSDLLDTKATSHGGSPVKQELLHLSLARQALIAEKDELTRLLEHRESVITELRQQVQHRDRTIHAQRAHLDDALRQVHSGKRGGGVAVRGESPGGRNSNSSSGQGQGQREDVQLVRDAIMSLRGNFRETDPTQHTIDTLEQAIAVLLERSSCGNGGSGGGSGGLHTAVDKSPRCSSTDKRTQLSGGGGGGGENWTKVIYFTERTVTPFMSTVGRRLGEVTLRDFKAMFDRPGTYRFHFKSNDPEYGMVKEEVMNDDDILPGVDGKIIAWVEENTD